MERSISYGIVWDAKDRGADRGVTFLRELRQQFRELFSEVFKSIIFDNGHEFSTVAKLKAKAA